MTSYVTPKKNAAFITYVSLEDQANAGLFKTSPTLAAGDFKVSIDGGALNNLATLPTNTPSGSAMVKISLSADEMNGDNITVVCKDAAGAEWYDLVLNIQTSARQIDDLAATGADGDTLETLSDQIDAAAPSAATVADAVWDEVISGHLTSGTTGARLNTAASASGSGSTAYSNTVTDSASAPLDGVEVWITSDSGGAATVASTTTDTLGAFTVWLDPGTYYLWLAKGGYNFGNPTTITVS